MHRSNHLFLLLVLLLPLSMTPSHASASPSSVKSDSCDDYSIQYPFYLSEAPTIPSKYCGYPGMGVFCDNGTTPILFTDSGNYSIWNFDYSGRTVHLIDTDVLNAPNDSCFKVRHNLTFFNHSWLHYTPSDANLTFFFNCSRIPNASADPISCLSKNPYYSYVFPSNATHDYLDWAGTCSDIVVTPVYDDNLSSEGSNLTTKYWDVLDAGFELAWGDLRSDDCKSCEQSGRKCGFNQMADNTRVFICFCSDGTRDCGGKRWLFISVATAGLAVFIFFMLLSLLWHRRRRPGKKNLFNNKLLVDNLSESKEMGSDMLLFDFLQIEIATNNFSAEKKLGQGGFGPVYKGLLPDGQEIAVKRLARNSGQGVVEFKNEILVISKLQHINLVKLLGCCLQGEEKLLVYEFMPNKSLDFFLFDQTRGALLDWPTRFHIIEGVVQGLIYLHKHSRLKIIHRDLKASNILLDGQMNPKISDFGIARIFCPNEDQGNVTNNVAGTFGYISPEYAVEGRFSIKSDVFSFGVLLLEIVSGKKNAGLNQYGDFLSLLGYAWDVWKEGRWLELVDPLLGDKYQIDQVMKCIHVALLCVQEKPSDRPTMSTVMTMVSSESSTALSAPKQPGFFNLRGGDEADESSEDVDIDETCSLNGVTVTEPMVR